MYAQKGHNVTIYPLIKKKFSCSDNRRAHIRSQDQNLQCYMLISQGTATNKCSGSKLLCTRHAVFWLISAVLGKQPDIEF